MRSFLLWLKSASFSTGDWLESCKVEVSHESTRWSVGGWEAGGSAKVTAFMLASYFRWVLAAAGVTVKELLTPVASSVKTNPANDPIHQPGN